MFKIIQLIQDFSETRKQKVILVKALGDYDKYDNKKGI